MIKPVFLILFLILLTSCAEKRQSNQIIFKDSDLPKIKLQSVKIDFSEIMDPRLIDRKGKFLFVLEGHRTSTDVPAIHIINTENWSYYRSKGIKGHGPYELSSAQTFFESSASDTFMVYSGQDKKVLGFTIQDTSKLAITEYKQPEVIFRVVHISEATDSTFLGISVNEPTRLIEFHKNGQILAGYGEWEKVETHPELNNFDLYLLNDGWFKGDKELGLHVKACLFRNRMEIFNYDSKEFIIVDGPSLDLPTFQMIQQGNNTRLYIPLADNPYTYRDISITKNYIFALYGGIGQNEINKTNKIAEKIYVFTHKGQPVTLLELDQSIRSLTVDISKKKIYGLTTDENPGIAVFNLPDELL